MKFTLALLALVVCCCGIALAVPSRKIDVQHGRKHHEVAMDNRVRHAGVPTAAKKGRGLHIASKVAQGSGANRYGAASASAADRDEAAHPSTADSENAEYSSAADSGNAAYSSAADSGNAAYSSAADSGNAEYSSAADSGNAVYSSTADSENAVHSSAADSGNTAHPSAADTGDAAYSSTGDYQNAVHSSAANNGNAAQSSAADRGDGQAALTAVRGNVKITRKNAQRGFGEDSVGGYLLSRSIEAVQPVAKEGLTLGRALVQRVFNGTPSGRAGNAKLLARVHGFAKSVVDASRKLAPIVGEAYEAGTRLLTQQ